MPRGGKRQGTGRPKNSGKAGEPTKTVRVPVSFAEKIPDLLKQHQEENFDENLQLPAKVREKYLPLEGLPWDAFESFCLDFIARVLDPHKIYRYGTQGDVQEGIDIVAELNNGEKRAFQCKQWQRFNRSDAIKVVKQAEGFEADRLILLLSRVASVEVRKVIEDTPAWEVWDVEDISKKVRDLSSHSPEVARRLVRDHFHPEWQNAFLGISKLTPFISSEDFFHAWLNTNKLFNHTWQLEGREDTLKNLYGFVNSKDEQVAILPGRGGLGKTKVLYEFANTFEHPDFLLLFVEDGILITPENADNLPLKPCIIVLDDAHRREQDVIALCKLIHNRIRDKHPAIKLILSSRPYGVQSLQMRLDWEGINYLNLDELETLSRVGMKALARQAIGQDYAHFADQLAEIAHDSPLVALVGGRLLADQSISLNLLERNEDFRRTVLSRFEDVLIGQISQQINPDTCKKILRLIAATAPIKLRDERFQKITIELLGIDRRTLIDNIESLEKAGVLLRRSDSLRITPDVLADHILHKACLTEQGDSTGYAQEIFETFKEIDASQILRNLAELDWRVRSSDEQEPNLLNAIFQSIREEFKQAPNLGRCGLLSLIKETAYYQPADSLEIVQFAIRHSATAPEDESVPSQYRFTHLDVLAKLPEILNRISYTLEYVPICCDLLWQLGRDDESRPYNNPPESISVLIDLAKYGSEKALKFNWQVLGAIERWLQEPNAYDHIYSPLDILNSFFEKEIRQNSYDGRELKISKFLVDHQKTQEIRKRALGIVVNSLGSNNIKVVLKTLEILRTALEELHDRSGILLEEANQWWDSERLEILEIIHSLVGRDIEPLVQLKVIEKLDWHARRSSSDAVKHKAQNIIDSIPRTDALKLTGTLSNNYQWNSQANELCFEWEKHEKFIDLINKSLAEEFLEKYPSPHPGIQVINERLSMIIAASGNVSTGFLISLSKLNPKYSIELCEQVLEMEDCPLATHMATILHPARGFDIKRSIQLFQSVIESGAVSCCQLFAGQYWAWGNDISPDDFREICQKLLSHSEFKVRKAAISSLAMLIQSQPRLAISLALDVDVEENSELAEELFRALNSVDIFSLPPLADEELKILLHKLTKVNDLSDYHISKFLVSSSKRIPDCIFELMLSRIEISTERDDNYSPLPSDYYKNCLHYLSDAKEYEGILRKTRDIWLGYELKKEFLFSGNSEDALDGIFILIELERLYKELFKGISFTLIEESRRDVSPVSLKLLDEWIDSENSEKIGAASTLINQFHSGFIFSHLEFVINLLEKAYQASDECYQAVSSNLFSIAASGTRMGTPGEPFPEDIRLREKASAISKRFFKGSPIRKFFDSLEKCAEEDIKFQRSLCED